jgi:hypothetical protein
MQKQHFSLYQVFQAAIALFVLHSLSCSLFSRAASPTAPPALAENIIPTLPPQAPPAETEAVASNVTGGVAVDYVYTSNLITIIYPLYGSILDDFVVVTLNNQGESPAEVLVASEISGYTSKAMDTVTVQPGETLEVRQNPLLAPEKIEELNVEKPAQFHIRVAQLENGEEKTLLEETGETLIYARRDFPWSIPGFSDPEVFELIAAMSTPNDPAVEALIRQAAEYTSSGIMWSGYGDNVNDEGGGVWDRLQAIWQAEERDYDLTYISTWVSFAPGSVQRIRLPAEVLEQRSGNCIELALLYAAAAEAMDLEAAIVGVPGHAFVGVRMDQENADYYFIETTLIGRASFEEAVNRASEEFKEALPHLEAKEPGYGWVTIWDARQKGILPLPWR